MLKGLWFTLAVFGRVFRILIIMALLLGLLVGTIYAMQLDRHVRAQFEGKRWALPARVFARPLELYVGQKLLADNFEQELRLLNYQKTKTLAERGQYMRPSKSVFEINTRGFQFAEDKEPARSIRVEIKQGKIANLSYRNGSDGLEIMRLDPILIGNFYPSHKEDRILIRLQDVSPVLIQGLLAVEDKRFYEHQGVNPLAITRALLANIKAGGTVQGGSTITQQLVKNFFLTNERSWRRKAKEAIMAVLLELRYDKDEILEAYLNEIYLGQDGERAIHGFGLAAQFYFNRTIQELRPDQMALLIGLAKGAGVYNPRRSPEASIQRRNLVLRVMHQENILTLKDAEYAASKPLGVSAQRPSGASPFPHYLDLVRNQLQRDYREEDLRTEGLLIFTTMDPIIQLMAEKVLINRVGSLAKVHRLDSKQLESAMVISTVQNAEIIALVGGKDVRYPGYNRAIKARRQIGSLLKPVIYLTGFEQRGKYRSLSSRVSDGPVTVKVDRKNLWQPRNYDQKHIGVINILQALEMSRNTPAVRVGVEVGIDRILSLLNDMGIRREIPEYPSILLGALELTPLEVQQFYQTMASSGSFSPLKAIRSVMNIDGELLTRYPLTVKQVARPESIELIQFAMHQITRRGTARALVNYLPDWKRVGGKTGTTNDKRDSWFSGFSGEHVMTVWVGRDDNKPTKMTGGTGALKVWGDMMRVLPSEPLAIGQSRQIVWVEVDSQSGLLYNPACGQAVKMPFSKGSEPTEMSYCKPRPIRVEPVLQEDGSWIDSILN